MAAPAGPDRPLLVDVMHDRSTPARALGVAGELTRRPQLEAHFHGGFAASLRALLAHRLDVAFGRSTGSWGQPSRATSPDGWCVSSRSPSCCPKITHWASEPTVPLAAIAGLTIDTSAGNPEAPEWVELGEELVTAFGGTAAPEHHPGMAAVAAAGPDSTGHHLRTTGWSILTKVDGPEVTGAVVRPLVDPVPLCLWTMVNRRELRHRGLEAINRAVDQLAEDEHWLVPPHDAWLPAAVRELLTSWP